MDRTFNTGDLATWPACNNVAGAGGASRQTIRIEPPQRVVYIGMGPQAAVDADRVGGQILAGLGVVIAVEIVV